jgi:hypothetical protein
MRNAACSLRSDVALDPDRAGPLPSRLGLFFLVIPIVCGVVTMSLSKSKGWVSEAEQILRFLLL